MPPPSTSPARLPTPSLLAALPLAVACDKDDAGLITELTSIQEDCPACVLDFIDDAHATDRATDWTVRVQCVEDGPHY